MDMFDWKTSGSQDDPVSSKFWIYWTVSIPLTILLGIGLRVWWHWEKKSFDHDVLWEIENINKTSGLE
jgi:hypothetical protein